MAEAAQASGTTERIAICGNRYEVLAGTPLPDHDHAAAKAYVALAARGGGSVMALVLRPGQLARQDIMGNCGVINSPLAFKFIDTDVAYWPEFRRYVPIILYEKPAGPRLMARIEEERPPINGEVPFRTMVQSLCDALRETYLAGVNHGRINPTNLYARDSSGTLQLGDCLAGLPGLHQPYAFETIERMMANPAGRGPVSSSEDIYAMGVSLLTLMLGKLPVAQMDIDTMLQHKIEKGSLMTLLGGMRLPSAYSELMRGLIADDPKQRWNLDDIGHWLGGRRLGSKPSGQIKKAQRNFDFGGKPFSNPRLLAHAMTKQPDLGARIVEDGSLDRWLRRSIGDEDRAELVSAAAVSASAQQRGGTLQERVVTRVTMAIDPAAPVRFREAAAFPGGVGGQLSQMLIAGQPPKSIADIISAQFILSWINSQTDLGGETTSLTQTFEAQRMLLERNQYGFGIERVAYELNPSLPCLSSLVESYHPLTLKAVATAIEEVAANTTDDDKREPMDRHIAAFVLNRNRRMNDRLFSMLAPNSDAGQRAVAILHVLAELQKKFHPEDMPATTEWMGRLLLPSIERFNNRPLRERVLRDLKRLSRKGRLDELLLLVDDSATMRRDGEAFDAAAREYALWEIRSRDLSSNNAAKAKALLNQGRQVTAFLSAMLAIGALLLAILMQVT